MLNVIEEIAAERRRQVEVEGWTPEHDDKHDQGEIARAAAAYAYHAGGNKLIDVAGHAPGRGYFNIGWLWPWHARWWKPKDRRRDLVRAAALIVAEIERLDRLAAKRPVE